ncbi:MAG: cytochrome c3 family protein [Candidatus Methylacidiphilales bacterium]
MANIFPKQANWVPVKLIVILACIGSTVALGVTYYATPKYTRVGYQPTQPVSFDHSIHVQQLGLDCRYCHFGVDQAAHSNVPNTQICMTCHTQVRQDSNKLEPVRESWKTGEPIQWVRVHKAPDYVYFNHAIHVNSGISCVDCHGQVNRMEEVKHAESHSMGFCLDCHRQPEKFIRPLDKVYDLDWKAAHEGISQEEMGAALVADWKINPPETCAGCHR